MAGETKRRFKNCFWQPPRPHGAVDPDRVVTNLELFYDLVWLILVGRFLSAGAWAEAGPDARREAPDAVG